MEVREASASYAGLTALQGDVTPVGLGYKRTEVGVVPTDWLVVQAGDLHPFVTSGSRGWAMFYSDTGEPFIRITNLARDCIYPDLQDLRFVKLDEGAREGMRTQLQTGDVLIAITADIGIVGYVSAAVPKPAYINQHIALIRFDRSRICSKYVSYFWAAENSQRAFRAMTDSGAKAGMNLTTVKQILLAAPPTKAEQEAIAEALSDADALIESLEQLIAKKRQIKQGTMQALLTGKQRLPGFEGKWEIKRLEQAGCCLRGVSYRGDSDLSLYDTAHTKRLLRSNNVQEAAVVTTDVQYVNEDRVSDSQILQKGDILICMANGSKALVGKSGLFNVDDGYEYTFGAFMGCFRTHSERANSAFIFSLFQTRQYRSYINNLLAGSSINNLRPSSIESLEFSFPEIPEQTAIATILTEMDTELAGLETRLAKTRQLKQGMMQELLTGRIRLV